jgi:hypothetical protein
LNDYRFLFFLNFLGIRAVQNGDKQVSPESGNSGVDSKKQEMSEFSIAELEVQLLILERVVFQKP